MAHPLHRPVIDEQKGIVTEGYGLLQPRIGFDIESVNKSLFSRIFAGEEGIDPYASAISDVYQDLFGEGIFTGKGIYDLEVFQKLLKDAIPDNTVLSHDLLEGSYVRAGLVTDIEFIDGYPFKAELLCHEASPLGEGRLAASAVASWQNKRQKGKCDKESSFIDFQMEDIR